MLLGANPGSDRIVHDHGLWGHFNWCAWRASRQFGVPYLLSPRGMIEPWAMANKRWKKRLAMAVFQRRILQAADMFVATAASEYVSIRAAGLRNPVAILPNGVDTEAFASAVSPGPSNGGLRTALFLSRIQPVKGLLNLVEAWAGVAPVGWRLLIAGPDEGGHLQAVRQAIRQWRVEDSVSYLGPVEGPAKWDLYRSADLFVLPTFSENFGLVIAEALACGVPVITTRAAPWSDLDAYRCGWWVEVGVAPLAAALREATALDAATLRAMGEAGRTCARRYDWATIAVQMTETYRWVLHRGDRPGWIHLD
jgi:glycosyltransferase involved in cell wall biosynthesis